MLNLSQKQKLIQVHTTQVINVKSKGKPHNVFFKSRKESTMYENVFRNKTKISWKFKNSSMGLNKITGEFGNCSVLQEAPSIHSTKQNASREDKVTSKKLKDATY